jgi:hypothetical protein
MLFQRASGASSVWCAADEVGWNRHTAVARIWLLPRVTGRVLPLMSGPAAQPFARLKQSSGLFESGLSPPSCAAHRPPPLLRFTTHPTPLGSSTSRRLRRRGNAALDRDGWVLCEVKSRRRSPPQAGDGGHERSRVPRRPDRHPSRWLLRADRSLSRCRSQAKKPRDCGASYVCVRTGENQKA